MVSQNLERVLSEVKAWDLNERQQLLAMLVGGRDTEPKPEDRALASLLAKGIIARIAAPPTPADVARHYAIIPVAVEGQPVSESLIEDRR